MSYSSLLPLLAMQGMGGNGMGTNPTPAPPQGLLQMLLRGALPGLAGGPPANPSPTSGMMPHPMMGGGMTPGAPPMPPGAGPQQAPGIGQMLGGNGGMFQQLLAGLKGNQQGVDPNAGQGQGQNNEPWIDLPSLLHASWLGPKGASGAPGPYPIQPYIPGQLPGNTIMGAYGGGSGGGP